MMHCLVMGVSLAVVAVGSPGSSDGDADATVTRVLQELEQAGNSVETIRGSVEYTVEDTLNLTTSTKFGTILFKRSHPHAMFYVHFFKTQVDDIVHRDAEWWLFRDRWLWEAKARSKTIIKREMVRKGEEANLFDLESSPIPMPFGQKEAEIRKNFAVRLMPPQLNDPPGCDHLFCVPKAGSRLAEDFKRLEYYVSRKLHLPVKIVAQNAEGTKVTTATFPDLAAGGVNVALDDAAFALPKETKGFSVTEEPLKEAARAP